MKIRRYSVYAVTTILGDITRHHDTVDTIAEVVTFINDLKLISNNTISHIIIVENVV